MKTTRFQATVTTSDLFVEVEPTGLVIRTEDDTTVLRAPRISEWLSELGCADGDAVELEWLVEFIQRPRMEHDLAWPDVRFERALAVQLCIGGRRNMAHAGIQQLLLPLLDTAAAESKTYWD